MNESELSITALMGLIKQDADEIIGKGVTTIEEAEEQKPVRDFCGSGGSDRRYSKRADNFTLIRRKAHRMVMSGEWTQAEASAWIREQDEQEYASVDPEPIELEKRVNFPDQGHGYKETDGTITPPPTKHLTGWNEND